ncbi:MAG TPA: hypothetical protein VFN88_03850, partial [Caulobacteraceae bacterium]|nr:hypothetical protein [Caulobacteraceae bacterium]
MTDRKPPASRQEALAALAWMYDAGVDSLVEADPRDWLAPPQEAPPTAEAKPGVAASSYPVGDISTEAIARAASLDALRTAIEAIRPKPTLADGDPASGVMIVGE